MRDPASGANASVDGRMSNLSAELGFAGALTASWPLPSPAKGAKSAIAPGAVAAPPHAELKAEVTGDVRGVALNNVSVAFESAGRPEVLAGAASFVWGDEVATTVRLSAPWLDLDPVLGTQKGVSPLFALAEFAQQVNGLAGDGGSIDATLQIDQANLGHDLVGAIRIAAKSQAGALVLDELRASLPGGARLEIQGRISGQDAATSFDGDMTLSANSVARLGAWLNGGTAVIAPQHDSALRMRARLVSETERISLTHVDGDVGDGPLTGRLDYTWSGTPRLVVAVEGARIDARAVVPEMVTLQKLASGMSFSATTASASSGAPGGTAKPELSVRVRAAEVRLPDRSLRDVVAALTRTAAGLAVEQLQFTASNGVAVTLEGRRGADAAMEFKGALAAANADGLATLADMFDLPALRPPASLLPDVLPLRLAGTLTKAAGERAPIVVVVDGQLGPTDAKIRLGLEAGLNGWRTAPIEADVVLLGAREAQMLENALAVLRGIPRREPAPTAAAASESEAPRQARLAIRASGRASDGLLTAVRFDSPDGAVAFGGRARISDVGAADLQGDLTIQARDGRDLVKAWTGMDALRLPAVAGTGTARVVISGADMTLDGLAFTGTSGVTAKGKLTSTRAAGTSRAQLRGVLDVSRLEVDDVLAPLLQASPAVAMAAAQAADAGGGVWPSRLFDFAAAAETDVDVVVRAGQLLMPATTVVTEAQFTYVLRRGGIELNAFQGRALGGAVAGTAKLSPSAKGAAVAATVVGTGLRLESFGATGTADADLDLTGEGTSPTALVGTLAGRGTLAFAAAQVRELSPASLQTAIDAALKAPPDKVAATLRAALAADAARVPVALGPRKIAIKVFDGVAQGGPMSMATPAGKVTAQGALELATFALSGTWRVETAIPPFATATAAEPAAPIPLPPVVQRFQIRPQDLGVARKTPRPAVEVDALERELAVRKVERDLAELERLRRLDEERAAAEAATRAAETKAEAKPAPAPAQQ